MALAHRLSAPVKALWLSLGVFATACATAPEPAPTIIEDYVAAYNAQDMGAMTALMHPDIQWLAIEGETVAVIASGREDLVSQLSGYMEGGNPTTSTVDGWVRDGGMVVVREVVEWTGADGERKSQSALAVYEIEDGLVRRVWYLPATK